MSEKPKGHIYRNLLYLTQFGLNLALPPIFCLLLTSWLQEKFQLGSWIMIVGIICGVGVMVNNIVEFFRKFARQAKKETPERISYNKRW